MVVNTSAQIAILLQEPDTQSFSNSIDDAAHAVLSSATYVELAIIALSRGRVGRDLVDEMLERIGIEIIPLTPATARLAAGAFARFGRGRHPAKLNYGDCFAYALARERTRGKSPGAQASAERSLTRLGRSGASAPLTPRRWPR